MPDDSATSLFDQIVEACACEVSVTVNEHTIMYQSAAEWIAELRTREEIDNDDIDADLESRIVSTGRLYRMQFYPRTPIGFIFVFGTSLAEVTAKAAAVLGIAVAHA